MLLNDVIIKIGGEGGSVVLYGLRSGDSWLYSLDFIRSRDPNGEADGPAVANSWEGALDLLDRYPWADLKPVRMHPDFKERILKALEERPSTRGEDVHARHLRWEHTEMDQDRVRGPVHASDSWLYDE